MESNSKAMRLGYLRLRNDADQAALLQLAGRQLMAGSLVEVPVLRDLSLMLSSGVGSSTQRIVSFLSVRPTAEETEVLLEIICEEPQDPRWHIERLSACAALLAYQTRSDCEVVEMRDSALAALVLSASSLGGKWCRASFAFMAWICTQTLPCRSLGLDILAAALLAVDGGELLVAAAAEQFTEEWNHYKRRVAFDHPPPLLDYSSEVRALWSAAIETGCAAKEISVSDRQNITNLLFAG